MKLNKDQNEALKTTFVDRLKHEAKNCEIEAVSLKSGFNKGYFEGKAEALYLIAASIEDKTYVLDNEKWKHQKKQKPQDLKI